jgi:hypothetical protein
VTHRIFFFVQRIVVVALYPLYRITGSRRRHSWIIGPHEVASMVLNLARVVEDSVSVALGSESFYGRDYDITIPAGGRAELRRALRAPVIFARLAARARGFVYVGSDGFLQTTVDQRAWEFAFLRRKGRPIVCYFTGSDIRSPALMAELERATGAENIATHLAEAAPSMAAPGFEDQQRQVAAVADEFASVIFTAKVDQLSYLQRETEPFLYFFPDEDVVWSDAKHAEPGPRIVVHAPSSPILKGTSYVRDAVESLHAEGYDFEYRELIGVPHQDVMSELRRAHIALNEFYAFVPGVFGVEAMASGCALLTRADERIETDLPPGSNDAWLVTTTGDLLGNLRSLLDDPSRIPRLAQAGRAWVEHYATVSSAGSRFREILRSIES